MVEIMDRVRFVETDLMGVVHHANYLRWFEMGRVAYLRAAGVELDDLLQAGFLFPITDVKCKYVSPGRFDKEFFIRTTMLSFNRAKMSFAYEIVGKVDGVVWATGQTQNVFTNIEGRIVRLTDGFYNKIDGVFRQEKGQ